MTIYIYDYEGNAKGVAFDIEALDMAVMETLSGDEVLTLIYKDGVIQQFDSSDCRIASFNDGFEIMFHRTSGIDKLTARMHPNGEKAVQGE